MTSRSTRSPRSSRSPGRAGDDDGWLHAVDRLAGSNGTLADAFLARLLSDRAYAESGITVEELRSTSEKCFASMLEALRTEGAETGPLEALAGELGARRARQGIPLDSLIRAIRLDFSVLWEALASPDTGLGAEQLVRRADLVWRTVDTFAAHVQARYLAERSDLERADADLRHQYLTQLFGLPEPSPADLGRIAGALGVPVDGRFRVVAVGREDGGMVQRRLRGQRGEDPVFLFGQEHHTLVIRQLAARSEAFEDRERALYDGMAAAAAPAVEGLGAVRSAGLAAREIMRDLPVGAVGLFTLRDRFLSVARHRLARVGCDPAQLVLRPLDRCPDRERERILEAVRVFLATGSLVESARELFCHRNTIVNRLAAFERYTGLDLKRPRDAAVAVVALLPPGTAS